MSAETKILGLRQYLSGLQAESKGNFDEAIKFYKRACVIDPDLTHFQGDSITVDGIEYDLNGSPITFDPNSVQINFDTEKEESLDLTDEERLYLSQHQHALDFVFTEEQKGFLKENGYLVIEGLFSGELCNKIVLQIQQRCLAMGYDFNDHKTWSMCTTGFMDLWHVPGFYEVRQDFRLYSIFAQLLRRHDLICSIDRTSVKPPAFIEEQIDGKKVLHTFDGLHVELPIHNDMDLWDLQTKRYQGGLCLLDCPVGHGGFRCIPGFHKLDKIHKYREDVESGKFGRMEVNLFLDKKMIQRECIEIPMKKGDFIIWSSRLPHSNAVNQINMWRMHCFVQFIQSNLNPDYVNAVRKSVETGKKPKMFPSGTETSIFNRDHEIQYHKEVCISDWGRKIFGFDKWGET